MCKKKNFKNPKLTCNVDFNTVWSKLTVNIKLNNFFKNKDQIETIKI